MHLHPRHEHPTHRPSLQECRVRGPQTQRPALAGRVVPATAAAPGPAQARAAAAGAAPARERQPRLAYTGKFTLQKACTRKIEDYCITLDTCVLGKAQRDNLAPLYLRFKPLSPLGLVRLQGLLKAPAGRNARDLEIAWHIAPNGRAGGAVGAMGPALATILRAVPLRQRALSIGAAPAYACIKPGQIRNAVNFNARPRLKPPRCLSCATCLWRSHNPGNADLGFSRIRSKALHTVAEAEAV